MYRDKSLMGRRIFRLAIPSALAAGALASLPATAADAGRSFEIYGFAQADYIQDISGRLDPSWDDAFRPSKIGIDDQFGSDGQSSISVKQSRFGVKGAMPTTDGGNPINFKFEFDLFGTGADAGQTTFRLRHAYGEWGSLLAGQTNSLFMDGDVFPNTIDYWGPAGMVFYRNVQIRWTPYKTENSHFAIAIERPGNDIDSGNVRLIEGFEDAQIQNDETLPDLTAQWRIGGDWGHFQAAGILRKVGFEFRQFPGDKWQSNSETGWGINLGSTINTFGDDKILLQVVYGEGIASYMNDGGMDLAPQASFSGEDLTGVQAQAVPLTGIVAYYDHYWSKKWSSSIGYSYTEVDNTNFQDDEQLPQGRLRLGEPAHVPDRQHDGGRRAAVGQAHQQRRRKRRRRALPVHRQVQLRHQALTGRFAMITNRKVSMLTAVAAAAVMSFAPAYARGPAPDPAVKDFQRVVDAAYAKYKGLQDGKNADYIPILTETPSDLFGVVIVTKDGKVYSAGDVDYKFSIQSVSKPFTAALVMTQQSPEVLKEKIGVEPTGMAFNSKLALAVYESSVNPLVNAGAIAAVSLVQATSEADRWNKVSQNLSDFAGQPLTVLEKVYESEYTTAFGNRGIANLLYNWGRLYSDPEEALRVYTRECSVGVSAKDLGMMGATLANGGVNPLTKKQVMPARHVPELLAIMATAGFYDESGDWMFTAGLPAKTGVGGGIVAVVPGRFAIAAFSPRLNEAGNSIRSLNAIRDISGELGLGVFGPNPK